MNNSSNHDVSVEEPNNISSIDNKEPEETPGYKAPQQKTLEEISAMDSDDESLVKYKQTLLAGVEPATRRDTSRPVIVEQMGLVVDGHDDILLDLTDDLDTLKDRPIVVKEGIKYRIKLTFRVQHKIVSGLRYHHVVSRKGINVDKQSYMVGSYGPKSEPQCYISPVDEAPKGMIARGHYKIKSKFIDDDQNVHLEWEWHMDIKKGWS